MASHTKKDDYCLECHWETFHLDGKDSEEAPSAQDAPQWHCSDKDHQTSASLEPCNEQEDCCEGDDCSVDCSSVCDGFVDCDQSTTCSAAHCNDAHCEDDHCNDDHCNDDHCNDDPCNDNHCNDDHCNETNCDDRCGTADPICFDDHCFGPGTGDGTEQSLESLLGLGGPLSLDSQDFMAPTTIVQAQGQMPKPTSPPVPGLMNPPPTTDAFFNPYMNPAAHCHPHHYPHFHCHGFPKEAQNNLMQPTYPVQNSVNPADVFQMLGMCPDFSGCNHFHVHEEQNCPSQKSTGDSSNPLTCFHLPTGMSNQTKSPIHIATHAPRGPCRTHHRCRSHAHHAHTHPYAPYSPYSRHSRSSVSSQFISSPGETPPPLEGGTSSVLTSPEFSPTDSELHVCRWVTTSHGMKTTCGAAFSDPCALQEHLISRHMATVDGAKGIGYYCCWEGCHRPHEPFSQKSKLQGHFLTHSNYKNFKCSVCGKFFARQATLERHERSHRGEKPYKCPDCGKSFTDSSELKTHSRTHTGEKPFRCTYPGCDFQTGDSSNMSSHRLTHGERRHKCHFAGCTKSFTRPDQLKRHIRSTHKEGSSPFATPMPDQFNLSFAV